MTKKEATQLRQLLSKARNICAKNVVKDCIGCPFKNDVENEKYDCIIQYDDRPCDWILNLY